MPDGGTLDGATLDGASAMPPTRVADVRQHPAVPPGGVADLAAKDLAELAAGHHTVGLVLSDPLASTWTAPAVAWPVRVMPPGQPSTGVWWGLVDALTADAGHPDLLVVADYDPRLRYLCLTALEGAQW
jgi:hypothetical protein